MKSLKKILSIFAAFMMVVGLTMTSASAAGDGEITLRNPDNDTTYNLYKVFEAQVSTDVQQENGMISGISYYAPSDKVQVIKDSGVFELVSENIVQNNKVEVKLKDGVTAQQIATWLTTAGTDGTTGLQKLEVSKPISTVTKGNTTSTNTTVTNKEIKWTNLEYGYYLITTSFVGATDPLVTITSVKPNQTVIDKNEKDPTVPTDSKKIIDKETDNVTILTPDSAATAQVGDTISYQIQFDTRNHYYATTDTSKENPIDINSYSITDTPSGLEILPNTVKVQVGNIVIYEDGKPTANSITGDSFTIDSTTINVNLAWKDANGVFRFPSPSKLTITYDAKLKSITGSNGASVNYGQATDDPITEVKVYTADINVEKVDTNDNTIKLEGAVFKLYTDEACTQEVKFNEKGTNGKYTVNPDSTVTELVTGEDGKLQLEGLKQNTKYWLKEVKAPEGYTLILKAKEITTSQNSDGIASMSTVIEVENGKGTNLPSTGGMGTTMIYIAGAILMVGAAIIFVTNKRMKHE